MASKRANWATSTGSIGLDVPHLFETRLADNMLARSGFLRNTNFRYNDKVTEQNIRYTRHFFIRISKFSQNSV